MGCWRAAAMRLRHCTLVAAADAGRPSTSAAAQQPWSLDLAGGWRSLRHQGAPPAAEPSLAAWARGSRHVHTSVAARMAAAADEAGTKVSAREVAPVSWRTLLLSLLCGTGVVLGARQYKESKMQQSVTQSQQVVGQASVGGPFDLVDQDGKRFTDADLHGEFALLYFGFTHCPDICPDELEKVAASVDLLEKWTGGARVRPVFISVDPDRDRPALVKAYVTEFHPRMVGLTGPLDAIKRVSKSYRVYYNKTGDAGATDYLVDHSIIHYLIDPAGNFVTFFSKSTTAEQLAGQVLEHMAAWQREHPEYLTGKELKAPPPRAVVAAAAAGTK